MKNFKKIVLLSILIFTAFSVFTICHAASASISASSTSVNVGESVTISVNVTAATWNLHVSGAVSGDYADATEDTNNTSFTKTLSFSPSSEGTFTATLSGDVTDENGTTTSANDSVTITVSNPNQQQNNSENTQPAQEQVQDDNSPEFTDTSKTVYTTTEVNLRSSWSTSSSATSVPKDTELLLTGTSTEKVNGYIWYRVTYNGQLRYIASQYVTEDEPKKEPTLKSLSIEGVELEPSFSASVTSYSAKISNFTDKEIKVTATAQDSKNKVEITGNKDIKIGENKITIKVTADDGTEKTYTVKLTNEKVDAFGLKTLKVNGSVVKGFAVDKLEYEVSFSDLDKLDIKAEANAEGAKVEIKGNEKLKDGKNTITIVVTSKEGDKTVTYKITATKTAAAPKEVKTSVDMKLVIIAAAVGGITFLIIIVLIIKYFRDRKYEDEDVFVDSENENENDDDDSDDEYNPYNNDNKKDEEKFNIKDEEKNDSYYYGNSSEQEDSEKYDEIYNQDENDNKDKYDNNDEDNIENIKTKNTPEYTVNDLFDENYVVKDLPRKKGKGRHSK